MQNESTKRNWRWLPWLAVMGLMAFLLIPPLIRSQPKTETDAPKKDVGKSSYDQIPPVLQGKETFAEVKARDLAAKAGVAQKQKDLLEERYDLTRRVDDKCTMTRGKPIAVGADRPATGRADLGAAGGANSGRASRTRIISERLPAVASR